MSHNTTVDAGFLWHKAAILRHTKKGPLYSSTSDRLLKKEEDIKNTVFKIILTHIHSNNEQGNQMQFPAAHSNKESTNEHNCHHNHDNNQVKHQEGQHAN
jgi:hypothetical protein